jgi:hypothetical protein
MLDGVPLLATPLERVTLVAATGWDTSRLT